MSGKSDLNVRYDLGSARRVEREAYPAGWCDWGTRIVRVPYTEGTLVIAAETEIEQRSRLIT